MRRGTKAIGNFFGVTGKEQKQWKDKAASKFETEEFGVHLSSQSFRGKSTQDDFIHGATKMLSKIEQTQTMEEKQENEELEATAKEDKAITDSPVVKKGIEFTTDAGTHWTANETYEESDEDKEDKKKEEKATDETIKATPSTSAKFIDEGKEKTEEKPTVEAIKPTESTSSKFTDKNEEKAVEIKLAKRTSSKSIDGKTDGKDDEELQNKSSKIMFFDEKKDVLLSPPEVKVEGSNVSNKVSNIGIRESEPVIRERPKGKGKEPAETYDLVYGKEAEKHYQLFCEIEKRTIEKKIKLQCAIKMREYDWKIQAVDEIIELARDYYVNPNKENLKQWQNLKRKVRRSSSLHSHAINRTQVRQKVGALPEYAPIFTWMVILTQMVTFIVMFYLSGSEKIGVIPELIIQPDVHTFRGIETVHRFNTPNIWIGPKKGTLIGYGALYSPCIRSDLKIQMEYSRAGYSTEAKLGCCEMEARNIAGTLLKYECTDYTEGLGYWREGVRCGDREKEQSAVSHIVRPCCIGITGQCKMLTHKYCQFYHGKFFQKGAEHCMEVNCLAEVCTPEHLSTSEEFPWLPVQPKQWWRVISSLFLHQGIIIVAIVVIAEYLLFIQVERTAGWFRVMLIYLICGSSAQLTAASFSPYVPHVGGEGAVCGIIGVIFVELIQFWSLVKFPCRELFKLIFMITILMFFGTLPFHCIFGLIVGLFMGILCGITLLPYVTFGEWSRFARIILLIISLPLMICVFIVLLHLLVEVQTLDNCEICKQMDCVPYSSNLCGEKPLFE